MSGLLSQLGYWRMVTGEAKPPLAPRATVEITEGTSTRTTTRRPSLSHWDLEPESTDDEYMTKYERFYNEYEKYQEKLSKASGTISSTLEQTIQFKFNGLNCNWNPKELWEAIKSEFEGRIKLDGRRELAQCKLEQYSSVTEWMAAQSKIINDISVCDKWRVHFILDNLPKTAEWTNYAQMLELTGQTTDSGILIKHLLRFETKLKRDRGLSPENALFSTRRQKNGKKYGLDKKDTKSDKSNDRPTKCYGCGLKGHKISECKHPEKWQAHQKSKSKDSANTATEPTSSSKDSADTVQLFAPVLRVIPVGDSSNWIFDTRTSRHVTGIRDSIVRDYKRFAPGERQVQIADDTIVDAAGEGDALIKIDNPRSTIVLQNVLHVPACGNNQLISITQLVRKGAEVHLDSKGATVRRGGTLVVKAPIIGGLYVLRT
jgi:hypothetical protein